MTYMTEHFERARVAVKFVKGSKLQKLKLRHKMMDLEPQTSEANGQPQVRRIKSLVT